MGKQKNRKTELETLMSDVRGKHSKRMNALLVTLEDEDFMVAYYKALEYSAPKLQRTEIIQEEQDINITIEHVSSSVGVEPTLSEDKSYLSEDTTNTTA